MNIIELFEDLKSKGFTRFEFEIGESAIIRKSRHRKPSDQMDKYLLEYKGHTNDPSAKLEFYQFKVGQEKDKAFIRTIGWIAVRDINSNAPSRLDLIELLNTPRYEGVRKAFSRIPDSAKSRFLFKYLVRYSLAFNLGDYRHMKLLSIHNSTYGDRYLKDLSCELNKLTENKSKILSQMSLLKSQLSELELTNCELTKKIKRLTADE